MRTYFLRRFLLIIPTFIGITLMVFTITRFVPGGPIEKMIAQYQQMEGDSMKRSDGIGGTTLSDDQLKQLEEYYGFDKPVIIGYIQWLGKVLTGDLGTSTRYGDPVWDIMKERFPISIFFGLTSLMLIYGVCIPLGIVKAIRHGTTFDNTSSFLVFFGYAIPGYVLGCFLIVFMASHWDLFPLGGFISDDFEFLTPFGKVKDLLHHAVLPLCCYLIGSFAFMTFMMKNNLMDNLASDYVRTALAKGVSFKGAVFKHAMRNSLIPIATTFGNNIALLLTGSFLIEKIFDINGFGFLGFTSIIERDYPVVMGILVVGSLLKLTGNILSDICVAIVDPRIRFQ
ncbi:ABC transporter permease subunit [Elusimicrobiota bacterium]